MTCVWRGLEHEKLLIYYKHVCLVWFDLVRPIEHLKLNDLYIGVFGEFLEFWGVFGVVMGVFGEG